MAEKIHEPTAKKLRDAHRRGEVAKSREVVSLALYVAALAVLALGVGPFGRSFQAIVELAIDAPRRISPSSDTAWLQQVVAAAFENAMGIVAPVLVIGLVIALIVGAAQVRGVFSFEPLGVRFERISPGKGLTNLLAPRQWFEIVKVTVKAGLLVGMIWLGASGTLHDVTRMMDTPPAEQLRVAGTIVLTLFACAAVVYAIGAALDYAHQLRVFLKEQRMTTEELRRESRENEGDPHQKSFRRAAARDLAMAEMVARTAEASVVLVNPTHVSVALFFQAGKTDLPRVVAKGVDAAALRIRTEAETRGVPVFEDVQLARRVFREVAVDHYINEGLIDPVADVFRWAQGHDRRKR